jgi:hypothetical protein
MQKLEQATASLQEEGGEEEDDEEAEVEEEDRGLKETWKICVSCSLISETQSCHNLSVGGIQLYFLPFP